MTTAAEAMKVMHEDREPLRFVLGFGVATVSVALALADTFSTFALGWVCPASLLVAVAVVLSTLAAYSVRPLAQVPQLVKNGRDFEGSRRRLEPLLGVCAAWSD